jgi:hypothetical protein
MSVDLWPPEKSTPASKRFARDSLAGMALYVLVGGGGAFALWRLDLTHVGTMFFVTVTMAYVLLVLHAAARFFSSLDEVQRRMQYEALLFTAGAVAFCSFAYSLLEVTGAVPTLPHALIVVAPAMILVWRVAYLFVARRYK